MDFQTEELIRMALREDVGTGDITTMSTVPEDREVTGRLIAKEKGVICGIEVVKRVFAILDKRVQVLFSVEEGAAVEKGTEIGRIQGPAGSVLTGERTALNFLQHLSGVAGKAAECAEKVRGTGAEIVDTRKTTPGMRTLEKYAVRVGGCRNHRANLSDGVMIKDNHIQAAGGITQAVSAARKRIPHTLKIEVETETLAQVQEALDAGAEIIMLDNMDTEMMREAVRLIGGRAVTEASGNMGEKDLREVAETGVDYISIGALTHSVKAMDISLKF